MQEVVALLNKGEIKAFIEAASEMPIDKVALQLAKTNWPAKLILDQLTGRKKAAHKLPSWFSEPNVIYPPRLAMEQCSSEATANWKATQFGSNGMVYDLSGGLGVDTMCFARHFKKVIYVEPNTDLFTITKHNHKALGATNIEWFNLTAEAFLSAPRVQADFVYIDPARRDENNRKKHRFEDCTPNVVEMMPALLKLGKQVVIKSSPFLDIDDALRALATVKKVTVIAVNNECKEVLYTVEPHSKETEAVIETIQLGTSPVHFSFHRSEEAQSTVVFSRPLQFLYEPNSAVLKAGAFKTLASRFNLAKLQQNAHLYTSDVLVKEFPGRVFEVARFGAFNKQTVASLDLKKAIVVLRHFPVNVKAVLKKLELTEGGNTHLFCTSDLKGKPMLVIARLLQP
jgi:16S rRNA G966 N2-methylase RsmD